VILVAPFNGERDVKRAQPVTICDQLKNLDAVQGTCHKSAAHKVIFAPDENIR
jgi:hypothetical protein